MKGYHLYKRTWN